MVEAESSEKVEVVEWLLSQMKEVDSEGNKDSIQEGVEDDMDVKMEEKMDLNQGIQNMSIDETP